MKGQTLNNRAGEKRRSRAKPRVKGLTLNGVRGQTLNNRAGVAA
jgi:adhesin HecA-like repeat protein